MTNMISSIYQYKKLNMKKLIAYGFTKKESYFTYSCNLSCSDFLLTIAITPQGQVSAVIIDEISHEPYTLHLTDGAAGKFVGQIKCQYEEILTDIAEKCFEPDVFKADMTKRVIAYIHETYGNHLEFLWKSSPSNAIWRRKDNRKWYGVLLTISKRKLGIHSDEIAEVIDLRVVPQGLEKLIDHQKYYPGYHMNKKHWCSIILDGSVSFEDLCQKINDSYCLAKKQ